MADKGGSQFHEEHNIENWKGYIDIIRIILDVSGHKLQDPARQVRQCLSALLVLLGGKRSAAALGEWDLWIHSSVEKTY